MARFRALLTPCLLIVSTLALFAAQSLPPNAHPATAEELFQISNVWTIRLTFSPEEWARLRPTPSGPEAPRTDGFVGPDGKRNGLSALRGLDFEYVRATLDLGTRHFTNVGVRYKGNGTYRSGNGSGKISFKIDLNKFVKGQKLDELATLNLHNNITDASWMNEVLAYRLYRDAQSPAPRTTYARLFITVPGLIATTNAGLYSIVENVDANFAKDRFGVPGGAIFKPATQTLFKDLGPDWASYDQAYDPKTELTAADQQRIIEFCRLVSNADDATFARRLPEFVELSNFARYMAVLVWLANPDSLLQQGQNYYVYLHPTTRKLTFIPWDQDHSFGQFMWSPLEQQQTLDILHPWTFPSRFLERTFQLDAFRQPYLARLREFNQTLFQADRFSRQQDELARAIRPAVEEEPVATRREVFKLAVAGESFPRPFYGGTATPLKPFVRIRQASVAEQLSKIGRP